MTNTIYHPIPDDASFSSTTSIDHNIHSSSSSSHQHQHQLQSDQNLVTLQPNVETLSLYSVIGRVCFDCTRPSRELLNDDDNSTTAIGDDSMGISSVKPLQFDFNTIKVATDDFSYTNKLGQGGFGAVYKGRLPNGLDVAVKRLFQISNQGEVEFKNEVLIMANLQHRNLVRLLGFCQKRKEKLLIYEFIANASLDRFIFDSGKCALLDGTKRCKIIGGIARGLLYLHDGSRARIIHRDLKARNVLLDAEMNPKIADLGMAKMLDFEETQTSTAVIVGTYGYMAPEYLFHGELSDKTDVFSFGVLVLEIVSGRKNSYFFENDDSVTNLLSYAWKNWKEGTHSNFIDPILLDGSSSMSDILRWIHIGLLCVQEKAADRPTMASVVNMFNNLSLTLQIPTEPPFYKSKDSVNEDSFIEDSVNEYSINEDSSSELLGR